MRQLTGPERKYLNKRVKEIRRRIQEANSAYGRTGSHYQDKRRHLLELEAEIYEEVIERDKAKAVYTAQVMAEFDALRHHVEEFTAEQRGRH